MPTNCDVVILVWVDPGEKLAIPIPSYQKIVAGHKIILPYI